MVAGQKHVRHGAPAHQRRAREMRKVQDALGSEGVGLGRLLGTLAESVEIESRDGNEWLRLAKRNPARGVAAST